MNEKEIKKRVRNLIGAAKLDSALDLLSKYIDDNEKLDDLIIQLARYNSIKKEESHGSISTSEINQELNSLRRNILSFLRVEQIIVNPINQNINSLPNFEECLAMSMTRMKVSILLSENYANGRAVTISTIVKETGLKSRKLVVDFIEELKNNNLIAKQNEEKGAFWIINEVGKKKMEKIVK